MSNVLSGMTYTRGVILWNFDGGSINDVGNSNTIDDVSTKINTLSTLLETQITTLLSNNNQVILSRMLRREQGTYNSFDNQIVSGFNSEIDRLYKKYNSTGLVWMTNPFVSIPNGRWFQATGDNVHPSTNGDYTIGRDMVRTLTNSDRIAY